MLTPSSVDPNRKSELERKREQPETFIHNPKVEFKSAGLVDTKGKYIGTDPRIKK